jgi:hypothetical protein
MILVKDTDAFLLPHQAQGRMIGVALTPHPGSIFFRAPQG